ncbi:unnamed protein product, partial [Brassica napus]
MLCIDHIVNVEEKTVATYELIGIYCELIRLSYVPELSEIVKQFKTKHGKDFPTSAIELRPDSGVSRL